MEQVFSRLCRQIDSLLESKSRIVIAIDGSCTSGKSTLAAALERRYGCCVLPMDDFFLQPHQQTPKRLAEPGGNVDYERFFEEVLQPLAQGLPFSYRPYDCAAGCLGQAVTVKPGSLTVVEGSYSHHPYFGDAYDLRIFLTVSPELRRERISQRPAFLHQRFFDRWIPMEQQYFREFAICQQADLVADTTNDRIL